MKYNLCENRLIYELLDRLQIEGRDEKRIFRMPPTTPIKAAYYTFLVSVEKEIERLNALELEHKDQPERSH